jgi:ferritin
LNNRQNCLRERAAIPWKLLILPISAAGVVAEIQKQTRRKGMEIKPGVLDALNNQVGMEFEASLKYDAIGCYFTLEDLPQLAKFFFKQSTEEREHAHKIIKFILDRDAQVKIPALPAPQSTFGSPVEAVRAAQAGERKVSESIHQLYELACTEKDHATAVMLQWFITEQVEEEAMIKQMLRFVERGKESGMMTVEDYLAELGDDVGEK